jgi:hypothetical protein
MSKSLRSMSESERKAAIARRLSANTKGLGYWAAVDAQARLTKRALDAAKRAAKLRSGDGKVLNDPPRQ